MTRDEHIKTHKTLHDSLDRLVADWVFHTGALPGQRSVMDLIKWSCAQTENPTDSEQMASTPYPVFGVTEPHTSQVQARLEAIEACVARLNANVFPGEH